MGRSSPLLRAAIFDWGGTLTPWHTVDLAEQWVVYARAVHGGDEQASAGLAARILAAEEAAWQRARTGQGSAHLDDLLREVGLDADVYSSEMAWTKPHPQALREAAAALAVEPAEAVYVGDRPFEDVHGSQKAGMRAIAVPHSTIPLAQQVSVDVVPDGVAHELIDILAIVDRWRSS